ncbi:RNA polymerase sigma factor [Blastochloris viridis]|uniref:RNA polymerase sigma factor n=1 Tax=Blastochloris viridis TaxID=1079 RepID=UPI0009ECB0B3|nr:RNA polymerase sigma factor [Blastochloris viridis]
MSTVASESGSAVLRDLFLADYKELGRQLTCRLGSMDLAGDVLHETFLRLEKLGEIGPMHNPKAYLLRIALNIASDRRRAERRRLTDAEVDTLLDIADESPDPCRSVEAKSDLEALERAILELPPRRRDIFVAARLGDVSHRDLAVRFGVTVRTIEIELKSAVEHCAARLGREWKPRFGPRPRESSSE